MPSAALGLGEVQREVYGRGRVNIVALSGGESSAAVAMMCRNLPDLVLYFNDTKWEDADLYRYLGDISKYLGAKIFEDSDGRSPEDLAYKNHALPNNRMPFCSRILKAERLQRYATPRDTIYFGIGMHEIHRAGRIRLVYSSLGINTEFPLLREGMDFSSASALMAETGIERPRLYGLGFEHNNCSGGCVRQGVKQWRHLLRVQPEVYEKRARLEREFSMRFGPAIFLKDISLERLREIEEQNIDFDFSDNGWNGECIGICGVMV